MKKIIINNIEYEYRCVYATRKNINGNIGVNIQLEVFKHDIQLDKKEFTGYLEECICRHIRDSI